MDETALIDDAKRWDLDSFNRLVLAYQDRVYAQAYRMMGDSQSAEDATQEAFISAFRKLRSYRGGSFRAWLLRIVTNACYDELRRRQRRPVAHLEPLDADDEELSSIEKKVKEKEEEIKKLKLSKDKKARIAEAK